ncbi:MAG: PQQ-like beta-propeller repeat protein, partial [Planctomycetales bacterium]
GSSPIIHENALISLYDGFDVQYVVALDKNTGETLWKKDRAFDFQKTNGDWKKAYCTARVIEHQGRQELIAPAAACTEAFDPATGELLWTVRHGGMNASARPLYENGLVYLTNGMGAMVAVRAGGKGDVTKSNIAWQSSRSVSKKASQLLVDGLLYMIGDKGIAACVDAATGENVWTDRLDGNYAASPILAEGRIYFCNDKGVVSVVKPGRTLEILAKNKLDDGFMASPAIVGKSLILRTRSHLYRIEK